jgi:sulfate transport system substrate-binding protein
MRKPTTRRTSRLAAVLLPVVLLTSASAAAGSADAGAATNPKTSDTVNVVGYSIVAGVYAKLEAAFQATPAGKNVTFSNSFGASSTQAEDVVNGQPADIVNFSTQPDLQQLVDNGIVSSKWNSTGAGKLEKGFVADSVVVLVVRKGNPLGFTGWQSLASKKLKNVAVQIVTPDPISSGSARWNLLEVYESQIIQKATAAAAYSFTNSVVGNVVSEPTSGSKALTAFLAGTGNVLLAYEADAQAALAKGDAIQIVYPKQNIAIQTPAALTDSSIPNQDGAKNPGAKAFFSFLFSSAGQTIFAHNAFRPTLASVATATKSLFPHVYPAKELTTITGLGGWPAVTNKFFSSGGIITLIEKAHGYSS